MKKIILILIFCEITFAQIFKVSSGTDLYISANTIFSADNLTLVPSSAFTLSDVTLTKNSTVTNSTSATYVARVYKFSATTNAYSGTLQVNYLDAELSGLTEATLKVNVHNGTIWDAFTSATNDATSNYVLTNAISNLALNEVALAASASPLPVELKSFKAHQLNGSVILSWITATESANFCFDVERKTTKSNWEKIGFVKGNGTSTSEKYYTFKDDGVKKGKYSYRLKQIDRDGTFEYHNTAEVVIGLNPTKIVLDGNYPNPFNSTTVISYQIPKTGNVEIKLYNLLGKEIATIENEVKEEGFHEVKFNSGSIPSGVYYYKLQSNNQTEIKKMVLMK